MYKRMLKKQISRIYHHLPKWVLKTLLTPKNLVIEPVAGCNVVCSACPQDQLKRPYGQMKFKAFTEIIDKTNPKSIGLYFMGEPFLNKDIFSMITYAHVLGCKTTVNTNGSTLIRDAEKIAISGLDKLAVSLDGYTQDTMEKYRHGINAVDVIEGLEKLKEVNKNTVIEVRTLLFKPTIKELPEIRNFVNKLGFKHRLIEPIITGWGGKQNPDLNILGDTGRVKNHRPQICPSLYRMAITWDGWVLPCCNDVHASVRFGNIFNDNYMNIMWGSDLWKQKALRQFEICKNCMEDVE